MATPQYADPNEVLPPGAYVDPSEVLPVDGTAPHDDFAAPPGQSSSFAANTRKVIGGAAKTVWDGVKAIPSAIGGMAEADQHAAADFPLLHSTPLIGPLAAGAAEQLQGIHSPGDAVDAFAKDAQLVTGAMAPEAIPITAPALATVRDAAHRQLGDTPPVSSGQAIEQVGENFGAGAMTGAAGGVVQKGVQAAGDVLTGDSWAAQQAQTVGRKTGMAQEEQAMRPGMTGGALGVGRRLTGGEGGEVAQFADPTREGLFLKEGLIPLQDPGKLSGESFQQAKVAVDTRLDEIGSTKDAILARVDELRPFGKNLLGWRKGVMIDPDTVNFLKGYQDPFVGERLSFADPITGDAFNVEGQAMTGTQATVVLRSLYDAIERLGGYDSGNLLDAQSAAIVRANVGRLNAAAAGIRKEVESYAKPILQGNLGDPRLKELLSKPVVSTFPNAQTIDSQIPGAGDAAALSTDPADTITNLNARYWALKPYQTAFTRAEAETLPANIPSKSLRSDVNVKGGVIGNTMDAAQRALGDSSLTLRLAEQPKAIQTLQRIQAYRMGLADPILPRDFSAVRASSSSLGMLSEIAAGMGLVQSPDQFIRLPLPQQEQFHQVAVQQFPQLFEIAPEGFMSFANGKIGDPREKQWYAQKVTNSGLPESKKGKIISALNRDGTYVPMNEQSATEAAVTGGIDPEQFNSLALSMMPKSQSMVSTMQNNQSQIDVKQSGF